MAETKSVVSNKASNHTAKKEGATMTTKSADLAAIYPLTAVRCSAYRVPLKAAYGLNEAGIVLHESRCWVRRMCVERDPRREHFEGAKHVSIVLVSTKGNNSTREEWSIPIEAIEKRIAKQEADKAHKAAVEADPRAYLGKRRMPTAAEIVAAMSDDDKMRLLAAYAEKLAKSETK